MAFDLDPFKQAAAEVENKSMGSQILHSGLFHSARSAGSSKGSFGSKAAGLALGAGKLFLSLIPVPIVGAVVGATVDAINGAVRGKLHERHLKDNASNEAIVKFAIKDLTVENLDRFRWKVAHSFEELNKGITVYNNSAQTCDDMYQFALLCEQVKRRKKKLRDELQIFQDVATTMEAWITDLERTQGALFTTAVNKVNEKSRKEIAEMAGLVDTNPAHLPKINQFKTDHTGCKNWCYFKKQAKYNPSENWGSFKQRAGQVAKVLLPIAISAIAVRESDYSVDDESANFTKG